MAKKERVTVDLDAECYYLDGEFWTSWDHYGEEMADEINKLLDEQEKEIQRLKCINRQLEERLDRSIALDMSRCGKYIYGIHGGSND